MRGGEILERAVFYRWECPACGAHGLDVRTRDGTLIGGERPDNCPDCGAANLRAWQGELDPEILASIRVDEWECRTFMTHAIRGEIIRTAFGPYVAQLPGYGGDSYVKCAPLDLVLERYPFRQAARIAASQVSPSPTRGREKEGKEVTGMNAELEMQARRLGLDPEEVALEAEALVKDGLCWCGCGLPTSARFAIGHDAKLKSRIIRMFKTGDPEQLRKGKVLCAVAGWYELAQQAEEIAAREAERGKGSKSKAQQGSEPEFFLT